MYTQYLLDLYLPTGTTNCPSGWNSQYIAAMVQAIPIPIEI